ncbi:MAG: hypothetical protein ACI9KE_002396 [Polyangiales bacterium]|jgi:hypothetical protein
MPLFSYFRVIGAALIGLSLITSSKANAQDESLRLFAEPFSFTDVADAADDDDPFDLNLHVAFRRTQTTGTLSREPGVGPGDGRSSENLIDIGDFTHTRNELELGLDIGLYRDVMFFARLPLVLSDARNVSYAGSATSAIDARLLTEIPGGTAEPLFALPFESPTRSGVDTVSAGFAFSLMNQHRRRDLPTWTMLLEGRFGIGSLLSACDDNDADTPCDSGVSTGTHAVRFESRLSKRFRFAELFSGIGYEFAWAGRAEEQFSPNGRLSGYQNRRPPMRGSFTAGAAFIPWENRGSWQRFSIDVRARATYVSEGRDYSPLYDAFGTSTSPYLTIPSLEGIPGRSALRETPFNGLTDVQDHGEFGGTLALELQAARYVRFRVGFDFDYITSHFITVTDACNPGVSPSGTDDVRIGGCNQGIINSHHRPVLDLPGNRFKQSGSLRTRIFIEATAQF